MKLRKQHVVNFVLHEQGEKFSCPIDSLQAVGLVYSRDPLTHRTEPRRMYVIIGGKQREWSVSGTDVKSAEAFMEHVCNLWHGKLRCSTKGTSKRTRAGGKRKGVR